MKKQNQEEQKRLIVKTEGGVLIEDDGGFMNFFPANPSPGLGMIMGLGFDDDDCEVEPSKEEPLENVSNVIEVDFKARKRK